MFTTTKHNINMLHHYYNDVTTIPRHSQYIFPTLSHQHHINNTTLSNPFRNIMHTDITSISHQHIINIPSASQRYHNIITTISHRHHNIVNISHLYHTKSIYQHSASIAYRYHIGINTNFTTISQRNHTSITSACRRLNFSKRDVPRDATQDVPRDVPRNATRDVP